MTKYRVALRDSHTSLAAGLELTLRVSEYQGRVSFGLLPLSLHPISEEPETDEIPDWDSFDTYRALYRPERGVAIFLLNDRNAAIEVGEDWKVRVTSMRENGEDKRGAKKYLCFVDPIKRVEAETTPAYDKSTNMWVSELRSGSRVIEVYDTDARVERVRYMEGRGSSFSYEYDEYFTAVEGGGWELVTRIRVAGSLKDVVGDAKRLQQSMGRLARSLPSIVEQKQYPTLPEDGKTEQSRF